MHSNLFNNFLIIVEILQTNPQIFSDNAQPRRLSEVSIQSTVSGIIDNIPLQAINTREYTVVPSSSSMLHV